MNFRIKKLSQPQIYLFVGLFLFLGVIFFLFKPNTLESAALTTASGTMSNSRISFLGAVNIGVSAGASAVDIKTAGNYGDLNTNHLFPSDSVSIGATGGLTVASVVDNDTFILTAGLTGGASDDDAIYVAQEGTISFTFTTTSAIPANGDVIINIPDPATDGNDGKPDTADSSVNNGFDFNGITTSNITCPAGGSWSVTSATAGSGSGHTVICTTSSEIAASTALTVIVGDDTTGLINPAPIYSGHVQGTPDTYTIAIQSRDASDNTIDSVDVKVAPLEGILISATVDETITFEIQSVLAGTAAAGQTMDVTTTPYSIPWGTLSVADTFKEAAHHLTMSTNADGGYNVTIEEKDQMGKNGIACADNGDETVNCIQDTYCSADTCTESTGYNWTDAATYDGLGYTLDNIDGTDATFVYNSDDPCSTTAGAGTFCAKQLADIAASETKQAIMHSDGPVNSKDVYVVYRIAISGIQPAGYYYTIAKYTVTAIF